jgi:hypothetical protein
MLAKLIAQYLDVWAVGETSLTHKQRASVIPDSKFYVLNFHEH